VIGALPSEVSSREPGDRKQTYWIPGYEGLGEHEQLDGVGGSLLDELDCLLDRGGFIHVDRRGVGGSHFELGLLWWRHCCLFNALVAQFLCR
jgi:hypothetical protein